ncbi:MAG: DUF5615 family PIN-like protein [Candidatus Obscuribacterales bacterium]|nr:DUF5615 family PIN-like protein [Candidatus Obscuribacterales bacterium]
MSLKLLVDECLIDKLLIAALEKAGHDVVTVTQINLIGSTDSAIFDHAVKDNRLVVTTNCDDFEDLHEAYLEDKRSHPGVLLIYLQNNPKRDLGYKQIVQAIANLEASKIPLASALHSLVAYNY